MSDGLMDAPNQQAVGLDPPWVEGTGGTPDDEPQAGTQSADSLDDMSKAELLEHAKSIGVSPANNDMTKDELRAAIDAHE
jgi:hypothetical protein